MRIMSSFAAAALLMALALPGTANATDTKRANGLGMETANAATEVSAQRRRKRVVRRYYRGPRYYHGPRYRNYYAYAPYPYYRRYYRPAPGLYFGGPGFSFGFGY